MAKSSIPFGASLAAALIAAGLIASPASAQDASDTLDPDNDLSAPDTLGEDVLPPPPPPGPIAEEPEPPPPRRRVQEDDTDEPDGIGQGPLRLFPVLETGLVYATNPGNDPDRKDDDLGLRLAPSLRLQSDWSRHELRAQASAEIIEYVENSDVSTVSGDASAAFRLDIRETTKADFGLRYAVDETEIGNNDLPGDAAEGRIDRTIGLGAGLTHDLGGIEARASLEAERFTASDVKLRGGGKEDNSDLDYISPSLTLRGTLNRSVVFQPFVEFAYEPRLHDERRDRNGLRRDSHGFRGAVGVVFNDEPFWDGEVAATYIIRDYNEDGIDTAQAAGLAARITWRPREFTAVSFTSAVDLAETSTTVEAERQWRFGLAIEQQVHDFVTATAGATLDIEDGAGDADLTYGLQAGVAWQINPYLALSGRAESIWFDSATAGEDYDDQRVIASIILRR